MRMTLTAPPSEHEKLDAMLDDAIDYLRGLPARTRRRQVKTFFLSGRAQDAPIAEAIVQLDMARKIAVDLSELEERLALLPCCDDRLDHWATIKHAKARTQK